MTIILSKRDLNEPKRPLIGGKPRTSAFKQHVRDLLNNSANVWFQADDAMYCLKSRFGPLHDIRPASRDVSSVTLERLTSGQLA